MPVPGVTFGLFGDYYGTETSGGGDASADDETSQPPALIALHCERRRHRMARAHLLIFCLVGFIALAAATGSIAGTVRDQTSAPISGVAVHASIVGRWAPISNHTDANGLYTISGLVAGTYAVRFDGTSLAAYEYYSNQLTLATATPVTVTDGSTTTVNGALTLLSDPSLGAFIGTVTDATSGALVHGISVTAYALWPVPSGTPQAGDWVPIYWTQTDAVGVWRIVGVDNSAALQWRVQFVDPKAKYIANWWGGSPAGSVLDAATPTFAAWPAQTVVDMALTLPTAEATGSVTDSSSGAPLAGVHVQLSDTSGVHASTHTLADGSFSLWWLPGPSFKLAFSLSHYQSSVVLGVALSTASPAVVSTTLAPLGCWDGIKDGTETAVDCGGGSCAPCSVDLSCLLGRDCVTSSCVGGFCANATCTDGIKNGAETSIDCGGGTCPVCSAGQSCARATDCASSVCLSQICQAPSCTDNVQNGAETDIDCGGGACSGCGACQDCAVGADCTSGVCTSQMCIRPNCHDGVKNANETDVDCGGGVCHLCPVNKHCLIGADCLNGTCCSGVCKDLQTDVSNCGSCGAPCNLAAAIPICTEGQCNISSCIFGYFDCNHKVSDGCEAETISDVNNCGGCGISCAYPHVSMPWCIIGKCSIFSCDWGYSDCNNQLYDGCEVDTLTDVNNCGVCGDVCVPYPNAVASCASGQCAIASCLGTHADCNGQVGDGCEVDTSLDANNCGSCGHVCTYPNALALCVQSACALGPCDPGYMNCNLQAADGCEINITNDNHNCGGCGLVCRSGYNCVNSSCSSWCDPVITPAEHEPEERYTERQDELSATDSGGSAHDGCSAATKEVNREMQSLGLVNSPPSGHTGSLTMAAPITVRDFDSGETANIFLASFGDSNSSAELAKVITEKMQIPYRHLVAVDSQGIPIIDRDPLQRVPSFVWPRYPILVRDIRNIRTPFRRGERLTCSTLEGGIYCSLHSTWGPHGDIIRVHGAPESCAVDVIDDAHSGSWSFTSGWSCCGKDA